MDIEKKLNILDKIYHIHSNFMKKQNKACKKYCSSCCTINVTLATLEGLKIIRYLKTKSLLDDLKFLKHLTEKKRYQPELTTNKFADLCFNKEDIPCEDNQPDWGSCPFLTNDECSIYPVRPMGCRSMISKTICGNNNYADMDSFAVTMNTVFLQFIEHIDLKGLYGNMIDILDYLRKENHLKQYERQARLEKASSSLLENLQIRSQIDQYNPD